ncbi:hypothetical protein [Pseudoalteromonas citrea]|nr:hypothetical protein [Pseudoalteromonas citrea]
MIVCFDKAKGLEGLANIELGTLSKYVFFILTFFLCIEANALSIMCEKIETEAELKEIIIGKMQSSEIVALVTAPELTDTNTTKHKVLNVWKGVVGEYIYVSGGTDSSILFTNRIEENGPLEQPIGHCGFNNDTVLTVLESYFGSGYSPSPTYIEKPNSSFLMHWPLLFGSMFLTMIGLYTYNFVRKTLF